MEEVDYKSLQESLLSNNNGSTPLETAAVILPSIFGLNLVPVMRLLLHGYNVHSSAYVFLVEFLCVVMPCILSFTVLSEHLVSILVSILLSWLLALYVKLSMVKKTLWLSFHEVLGKKTFRSIATSKLPLKRRPYITNFRAITNMLTVLCILAVDFRIFPRRFAKTETFGYGVMDFGVGLFVVANALVAPEVRAPSAQTAPPLKTLTDCLPLIVLGTGRLIATKQVEYHEHVTEYGLHWNFFFTLAVTKLGCSFLLKIAPHSTRMFLLLSGGIIAFYEIVLYFGLKDWILSNDPRIGFISANREGVASNIGYIALYFGGVALGRALYIWDKMTGGSNALMIRKFACIACVFWCITLLSENFFGVSRRMANMGYYFWILSFSVTVIVLLLAVELFALYLKNVSYCEVIFVPDMSEAINKYGLLFFLLGNFLTGVINLSTKTFLLSAPISLLVVTSYMVTVCGTVYVLYLRKIDPKF